MARKKSTPRMIKIVEEEAKKMEDRALNAYGDGVGDEELFLALRRAALALESKAMRMSEEK